MDRYKVGSYPQRARGLCACAHERERESNEDCENERIMDERALLRF